MPEHRRHHPYEGQPWPEDDCRQKPDMVHQTWYNRIELPFHVLASVASRYSRGRTERGTDGWSSSKRQPLWRFGGNTFRKMRRSGSCRTFSSKTLKAEA